MWDKGSNLTENVYAGNGTKGTIRIQYDSRREQAGIPLVASGHTVFEFVRILTPEGQVQTSLAARIRYSFVNRERISYQNE